MNHELLHRKLIAAARRISPSEAVPFAFEKRIMNRLRASVVQDEWATWGTLFWRALAPCCAVMIVVGLGNLPVRPQPLDLGEQIEAVLLAGLDHGVDLP